MNTRIKSEIISLAKASPDQEICGFVYCDSRGEPHVLPCKNVAGEPEKEFRVSIEEQLIARAKGTLLGAYHSHPGEPSGFSPADLTYANVLALPVYLANSQDGSWHTYVPSSYKVPLEGRPWCLGFNDCFETPRIYFRQIFDIYMADYDRDESFIHEKQGVIMASHEKEGFVQVESDPAKVRVHDVLMFHTDKLVPQHFGVFVGGGGYMIHHFIGQLSAKQMITAHWWGRLTGVFRHKTLL